MPKRRLKEEKPRKKMSRKQILLPPVIVGAATLAGLLVIQFFPAPSPIHVCLKSHNNESFDKQSRVQVEIDGKEKLLPDTMGKHPIDGKECIRVIHTDTIGDLIHIQFVRPIKLSLSDFMKIYTINGTIEVVDNSSGTIEIQKINLSNYDIGYSYFSEKGFTPIQNISHIHEYPPFDNNFLGKISLTSKKIFES